ncbi:MAG: hypothetical protein ACI9WS_002472 [Paraglaciecola psychrophila]|jgi:hypothetical protein
MRKITLLVLTALTLSACMTTPEDSSASKTISLAAASDYLAPRGPDGIHPDLNGIWQALGEAHYDLERHMASAATQLRQAPLGPVPAKGVVAFGVFAAVPPGMGVVEGGVIPYTPEALARRDDNRNNALDRDLALKCYMPGVPRATYMPYPFQILQGDKDFFISYQFASSVRSIYSEDPGPAPIDSWMGQSVASWEGETLVLDVTGLHPDTWLDRAGNHHSEQLHVVERYTPMSPNHLLYEATIEDPAVYTRPWKISLPLYRRMEQNFQILDFKCVEFVEELLYGQWRKNPLD